MLYIRICDDVRKKRKKRLMTKKGHQKFLALNLKILPLKMSFENIWSAKKLLKLGARSPRMLA